MQKQSLEHISYLFHFSLNSTQKNIFRFSFALGNLANFFIINLMHFSIIIRNLRPFRKTWVQQNWNWNFSKKKDLPKISILRIYICITPLECARVFDFSHFCRTFLRWLSVYHIFYSRYCLFPLLLLYNTLPLFFFSPLNIFCSSPKSRVFLSPIFTFLDLYVFHIYFVL